MRTLLFILLLFTSLYTSAQKQDYNWLTGIADFDFSDIKAPGNQIYFGNDNLNFSNHLLPIDMWWTPVTISDENGELLFYTNGNVVANKYHEIIENGEEFNEGSYWSDFPDLKFKSQYMHYSYQVYPDRDEKGIYYMVHSLVQNDERYLLASDRIQISKIDMNANEGRGRVVYKNRTLLNLKTSHSLSLVKHANGLDWWVLINSLDQAKIHLLLLKDDELLDHKVEFIKTYDRSDWVHLDLEFHFEPCFFNPQGNICVNSFGEETRRIFNFDRCSGDLQFLDTLQPTVDTFYQDGAAFRWYSMASFVFSPSGRYLYSWKPSGFFRVDMQAEDIGASVEQIGGVSYGMREDLETPFSISYLPHGQLGPDGKIYYLKGFAHRVIQAPDDPDDVRYCDAPCFPLDNFNGADPYLYANYYPNYRLGPLEGSPCDTIVSSTEEPVTSEIRVFPNPATTQITVDIITPQWAHQDVHIRVFDILGRPVYSHQMTPYSYLHRIDTRSWAAGVYMVHLMQGEESLAVEKVVKK